MNKNHSNNAKIFLSCGQRQDLDEIRYGVAVRDALKKLNFEVFYAKEEQEPLGLTQVIFRELETADYYVLLDFEREALFSNASTFQTFPATEMVVGLTQNLLRRGSLFTHQEFAIACFLGLEIAAFRESGIEELTGVVGAVMGNPIPFQRKEPTDLANLVVDYIQKRDWSLTSRHRLALSIAGDHPVAALNPTFGDDLYYHLNVKNLHNRKAATNCYAYIDRIVDLNNEGADTQIKTCELKWEGTELQGVRISPLGSRGLDACIFNRRENKLHFRPMTDASTYITRFPPVCDLEVTYVVCCDEFVDSVQKFRLIGSGPAKLEIMPVN
jgi:hypothetical protein